MKISKVQLRNSGLKGITINHIEDENRSGEVFQVEKVQSHKAPIHKGLRDAFGILGAFAAEILLLSDAPDCDVIGLQGDDERFRLNCQVEAVAGGTYNVWTPWINKSSDYKDFEQVIDLVEKLYVQVDKYAIDKVTASAKQTILDFAMYEKKDKLKNAAHDFQEALDTLNEDEILERARQLCQGHGDLILSKDDLTDKAEMVEEAKEEF